MHDAKLTESELDHFTGGDEMYRHQLGGCYTEGVRHVARRAGAYWLLDAVFSHQSNPLAGQEPFQVWTLLVLPARTAVLVMSDGNTERAILRQEIEYTDFPLAQIKLFLVQGVLMLPGEY
ncbi:DUF6876 family protein [Limnoglobus roseus]|uniref:DUF6876 domain-containing protein n=1 Tax=Limnoglobus roseus TaxID=2598579 RepID=A0A5C1AA23_9BACT|nr:DUF6876 family protein [Limnoglobus roseus]QEL13888.1 hypothetical protein PX52LOC_00746 [Limnoglobus roseus]